MIPCETDCRQVERSRLPGQRSGIHRTQPKGRSCTHSLGDPRAGHRVRDCRHRQSRRGRHPRRAGPERFLRLWQPPTANRRLRARATGSPVDCGPRAEASTDQV